MPEAHAGRLFDHIHLRVRDVEASKRFYAAALEPLGLGIVKGLSIVPDAESWSEDRRKRTLSLADTPFVELPTGSALVHGPDGWELVGAPTVHGELP